MIDQLYNLIKNQVHEHAHLFNDEGKTGEDHVTQEAYDVVLNGVRDMDQDTLNNLSQATHSDAPSTFTPEMSKLSDQLSGNISEKLGVNKNVAQTIALAVIPVVLKQLFSGKTQSSADGKGGFSLDGVLSSILSSGGASGGLMDKLSDLGAKMGLDKDGDGDVDLDDITRMFKR